MKASSTDSIEASAGVLGDISVQIWLTTGRVAANSPAYWAAKSAPPSGLLIERAGTAGIVGSMRSSAGV